MPSTLTDRQSALAAVISELEAAVSVAKPLAEMLSNGSTPAQLLSNYVGSIQMNASEHPFDIKYTCRCSLDRAERSINMLGREEVREIVLKDEDTKVRCDFCGRNYRIPLHRLREMLAEFDVMN